MRGLRLYLIIAGLAMCVYLVAEYNRPQPTDWTPSYFKEDKIPYGLYILHERIRDIFPNAVVEITRLPVYNTLKDKPVKNTSYIIVGSKLNLNKMDYAELLKYARRGNNVFLSAFDFGEELNNRLKLETSSLDASTKRGMNFVNPALEARSFYVFKKDLNEQYFSHYDTARALVLGKTVDNKSNFIKYPVGSGAIYVLPNPQLLTNYNLVDKPGAEYVAKALSYLPETGTLIWDEYNTKGGVDSSNVLRVIFKHSPLQWSYYLSIAGLLLFVFSETKRRQRIIPVIEPLKNSTVDFVTTVGKVYYQQRDNTDIARKKISYFFEFVRINFRLKVNLADEDFERDLVAKSGVSRELVNELVTTILKVTNTQSVPDTLLIKLNKNLEELYKQVK